MTAKAVTLEIVKRILELERARGYTDSAVMGGMDEFLRRWAQERPQALPPALLSPGYAALDRKGREEWASKMLQGLLSLEVRPQTRLPRPVRKSPPTPQVLPSLKDPITTLRGINTRLAAKFSKLGVTTVRELLYFFPRRHIDYSARRPITELEVGKEQTIVATVWGAAEKPLGRLGRGTEAIVGDDTGNIRVVWFHQPYLAKRLPTNAQLVISGKVGLYKGQRVFETPEYELLESEDLVHTGRLVPVYPLTEGLYPRQVRKLVKETVDGLAPLVPDFLPGGLRERAGLLDLPRALEQAHYPDDQPSWEKARRRLAFDELFLLQLGLLSRKRDWKGKGHTHPLACTPSLVEDFLRSLPFPLTSAQRRALEEILADLKQEEPMCRLLQGEVGSGKTVVATAACLVAAGHGHQAALMVPTEVLAEQHFENIHRLLSGSEEGPLRPFPSLPRPLRVCLLIGSLGRAAKQELHRGVAEGGVDIVIGTHALIQEGVDFKSLALAVVDEQHRFGVMQRSALREKGINPHLLVMSATPIPRTLALTLYGDLDLSLIDELPPGRQEIKTKWLSPRQRQAAYDFVRRQVSQGRQAFIICPLIEESAAIEAKAATTEYERLSQTTFPDLRLGLLHGRMPPAEKEEAMRLFRQGRLDILVSTPVVEVGIDVPNATVMVVEGADRFGLSQLHQFRGRVGRGKYQSYCLLLAERPSWEGKKRLSIIERTQDGFLLAEEDLRMRGPGEFFGTRQSGLPDLRMARLSDVALLETARQEATRLFQEDPFLKRPEHKPLLKEIGRLWQGGGEWS